MDRITYQTRVYAQELYAEHGRYWREHLDVVDVINSIDVTWHDIEPEEWEKYSLYDGHGAPKASNVWEAMQLALEDLAAHWIEEAIWQIENEQKSVTRAVQTLSAQGK